ncbi:MAG: ArnT family glycosyltransferase [Candidatus Paceibacterota bacterium]
MLKKFTSEFKDNYFITAFVLVLIAAFLRLYRLAGFVTFLGDQGRDAIVIRRILTFEHFPAIGAPTSVGQVYLGPFYYYFIAPWLAIFNFNPLGLAVGVALVSSAFILISYVLIKDLFDKRIAIVTVVMMVFAEVLIDFSRYSWNPNLLPFFSFFLIYAFIKARKAGNWKYYGVSGALLSFAVQLHYIALVFVIPAAILVVYDFIQERKKLMQQIKNVGMFAAGFGFFSLPLLIFDLRHDFLNTKSFMSLFKSQEAVSAGAVSEVLQTFSTLNRYAFAQEFHPLILIFLFVLIVTFTVLRFRANTHESSILLFFTLSVIGISLYSGPKYVHYFTIVYILYYLVIAYFLVKALWNKRFGMLIAVFLTVFIYMNFLQYRFIHGEPSNQIETSRRVARIIFDNTTVETYKVAGLPDKFSDSTYRYFLELWGKRSLERDATEQADELFVVCQDDCKPIGDPLWDIAYFAPREIVGVWSVEGVKIYKLIR